MYDLRHSARQLGHDARLTLTVYGHIFEELDGSPQIDAESAIKAAREAHVRVSVAPALAATP